MRDNQRSKKSIAREKQRLSPEIESFRKEIETFLYKTNAPASISFYLKKDLGTMTNMPYYKQSHGKKVRMKNSDVVIEYCKLLIAYGDKNFASRLLKWLTRNQNQSFRKLFKRISQQKKRKDRLKNEGIEGVWEHPVPICFVKEILFNMMFSFTPDIVAINEFITFIEDSIPQIFLTKEQNDKVNKLYCNTMPKNWDWKTDKVFERYYAVGLVDDDFLK